MANRNWSRTPAYGNYGGQMPNNFSYFGAAPPKDPRPYGGGQRFMGSGGMNASGAYRSSDYRRSDRKDDQRGPKRPLKGRSPDRRQGGNFSQKKDSRSFNKRPMGGNYEVRLPKALFGSKNLGAVNIRQRYGKLNVPGDVFEIENGWVDAFPLHAPFKLDSMNDFHVFHREVENPCHVETNVLDAPDADYSFSSRVMLIGCPPMAELYKSCCRFADEHSNANSDKSTPTKNFTCMIGGRAKNETCAVGGPWSPSMDGADPINNPQTLIRTAIRTFKGFTGIDLSGCSQWTRFMEIRYYRKAGTKAPTYTTENDEREITEDKVEVVVFYIPNLSHLLPTEEEWEKTKTHYNAVLQKLLNPEEDDKPETEDANMTQAEVADETMDAEAAANAEATHYSKLDVASMKVQDLKNELVARGLDSKGLKAQLSARLQTALNEEKSKDSSEEKPEEDQKTEQTPTKTDTPAPDATPEKAESKQLSEKERRRLERLYRLGDRPTILIHPNKDARGGRFDCHRVTLHALLEYRSEEMKEPNFEVALFAEQFHEMMQRDCAFNIFKAIFSAPEKEQKTEQSAKVNGVAEDDEPESKRVKTDSAENETDEEKKVRKLRRTVKPHLLFSFLYFDTGYAGYIREYDMCEILHMLGLNFSKSQMKTLVGKVVGRRDSIQYRNITDAEILEGDAADVTNLDLSKEDEDPQFSARLSLGNRVLLGVKTVAQPSIVAIGGGSRDNAVQRIEAAESARKKTEYQFFQIKEELERTRVRLNACKDIEDRLRSDNQKLNNQFKEEQKMCSELRHQYNTYSHLVRVSHDHMGRAMNEINKQYDREKAKREAERAAAEAEKEKAAAEKAAAEGGAKVENGNTSEAEEKTPTKQKDPKSEDFEVVDTV